MAKIREEGDSIYPNEMKGYFFPNWFNKEHFEIFLGEKMTDEDFELWKEYLMDETNIFDVISNEVRGFLIEFKKAFANYKIGKEVVNGR